MVGWVRGAFLAVVKVSSGRSEPGSRVARPCVHFADVPPSQAKYVTTLSGSFIDFVIDIRVGSPTFGQWDSVLLDTVDRRAIYLAEGLGHAVCSLADNSTVMYLCSATYDPVREHAINPLDPELGLTMPAGVTPVLSLIHISEPTRLGMISYAVF